MITGNKYHSRLIILIAYIVMTGCLSCSSFSKKDADLDDSASVTSPYIGKNNPFVDYGDKFTWYKDGSDTILINDIFLILPEAFGQHVGVGFKCERDSGNSICKVRVVPNIDFDYSDKDSLGRVILYGYLFFQSPICDAEFGEPKEQLFSSDTVKTKDRITVRSTYSFNSKPACRRVDFYQGLQLKIGYADIYRYNEEYYDRLLDGVKIIHANDSLAVE